MAERATAGQPVAIAKGIVMPISWRKKNVSRALPEQKVLTRPAPDEPAEYGRSRIVGDFVILDWSTAYGTVGLAYSLTTGNRPPPREFGRAAADCSGTPAPGARHKRRQGGRSGRGSSAHRSKGGSGLGTRAGDGAALSHG